MNENDIKKALEWCEQFENNIVFKGNGDKKCALALQMMVVIKRALKNYNRQKAEIERLSADRYLLKEDGTMTLLPRTDVTKIKAEAIKEFAERLIEGRVSNDPVVIAVKVELEEMVGERE